MTEPTHNGFSGRLGGVVSSALSDIGQTFRNRRIWLELAREDIGDQHRRTLLGPFWLLINYLLFVGVFILVFGHSVGVEFFTAYVSTGLLVWVFIAEIFNHSSALFIREDAFIKGTPLPLATYVMRLLTQSIIRFGYAAAGCLVLLVLAGVEYSPAALWALPGLALIVLMAPAVITVVAFIGAYFPDFQFIVSNAMRVGMFLTPIFWGFGEIEGIRAQVYAFNPFTYLVEIVRFPVVYGTVPWFALGVTLAFAIIFWILALLLLGSLRKQIAYVV